MKTSILFVISLLLLACGSENAKQLITAEADSCDGRMEMCSVDVDDISVSLRLPPRVEALKPFALNVDIENGGDVEGVIIDFQMVGMEMGPNRYRLLSEGQGWQGQATLPVCTTSRTDWLAVLEFTHNSSEYRVSFPFTSR